MLIEPKITNLRKLSKTKKIKRFELTSNLKTRKKIFSKNNRANQNQIDGDICHFQKRADCRQGKSVSIVP